MSSFIVNRGWSADQIIEQGLKDLLRYGVKSSPRDRETLETENYCIELHNPEAGIAGMTARGVSYKLIAAEFMMYTCGWCKDEIECAVLVATAPMYGNFLNKQDIFDGFYGEHIGVRPHVSQRIEREPFPEKVSGIQGVINCLSLDNNSRQAVINTYGKEDIERASNQTSKDVPCTLTLQFMIRDNKLNLNVNMRSSDFYWGLPHDLGSFTMIQCMVAACLGIRPGQFRMHIGSFHLYTEKMEEIEAKVTSSEGYNELDIPNFNTLSNCEYTFFYNRHEDILRWAKESLECQRESGNNIRWRINYSKFNEIASKRGPQATSQMNNNFEIYVLTLANMFAGKSIKKRNCVA